MKLSKGTLVLIDDTDANGHYSLIRAKVIRARGKGVLAVALNDDDSEGAKVRAHRNDVRILK